METVLLIKYLFTCHNCGNVTMNVQGRVYFNKIK